MIPRHHRASKALAVAALYSDIALAACSSQAGQAASTMDLLRSGSPQTCTTADVQKTLHDMIMPKPADIAGDGTAADKDDALGAISIAYRETTLQSFDQTVARATCNTTVHIAQGDRSDDFDVTFQVSPSSDDPSLFVIAANMVDAKAYARGLVETIASQAADDRQHKTQTAQQEQAKAALIAKLNPGWLVGKWIASDADASNCQGDQALTLAPDHVFFGAGRTGRWALDADQLHFIGGGAAGNVDEASTITQADAVSFTDTGTDGTTDSWRRCARAEIEPSDPQQSPDASPAAPQ